MQRDRTSNVTRTATRIAAGDDRTTYDRLSVTLHWLTAALVLTQFVLAQVWGFTPRPTRHVLIVAHMSFGIVLTGVLVVRIVWRLSPGHQKPVAKAGWVERAAETVHFALYVLLVCEAALGFILRWSGNESMSFFGLQIPPPFSPFGKPAHRSLGELHDWTGWTIIVLAACHAAAALFHHFVVRDDVLTRMLPGIRRR
ncbi:cytochrome b [Paraburkholderia phenoliruptrix]|uniref:cytochrome b n=1 Tax=Paraburkholderia phenoliruptrix TaxID=252970 RepID=UPI000685FA18|nr:cytochrome b/b6 domain-containing protein [Paraburkholderia phenoliruptrix]